MGSGIPVFPVNQSIEAVLMLWIHPLGIISSSYLHFPPLWLKLVSLFIKGILLIGLIAVLFHKAQNKKTFQAYIVMALSAILLPLSWSHYYLFFLPLNLYLLSRLWKRNRLLFSIVLLLFLFQFSLSEPWKVMARWVNDLFGRGCAETFIRICLSRQLLGGVSIYLIALACYFRGKPGLGVRL